MTFEVDASYHTGLALTKSEYDRLTAGEVQAKIEGPVGDLATGASGSIDPIPKSTLPNSGGRGMHISHDPSEQPHWQDYANCLGVDPDLFFPERGASTREAKEVCRGCPVRDDCLEFALVNGEKFGIWGGMSERERRRLRRQRVIARRAAAAAEI